MLLSDEEEDELSARSEDCSIPFDRERRRLVREEGAFCSSSLEEPFALVTVSSRSFQCSRPRAPLKVLLSGGLAIRAFGQCPVGRSVGVKSGPLGWAKITT